MNENAVLCVIFQCVKGSVRIYLQNAEGQTVVNSECKETHQVRQGKFCFYINSSLASIKTTIFLYIYLF